MKRWQVVSNQNQSAEITIDEIVALLLVNRGIITAEEKEFFLHPPNPRELTAKDIGIDSKQLRRVITRITQAIDNKESVIVYADYDADGITAGAIMWETLHALGAKVMPYIPHRIDEGYGFSQKGIDAVKKLYDPQLIISVDHGITAAPKIAYAKELGIEVIVTDHHVKPKKLPECLLVHTTQLCGAGVAWFVTQELLKNSPVATEEWRAELLALAAIGTIADMVPLLGANRAIVKYGLSALNKAERVGLRALIADAGLTLGTIGTYEVSHVLAPRLNAMGRLVHGLDALRLLCTKQSDKALLLAQQLGLTNKERQVMTEEFTVHAKGVIETQIKQQALKKLIFISFKEYNQGVIGLVAGKLVETFYRPAIVIAQGAEISKASARSIAGFNIIEAIRKCSELLVDAGGHPMAAGFTVETKHLGRLQQKLEALAEKALDEETLTRVLKIDLELPLPLVTEELWRQLRQFEPFGMGNPEPVFVSRNITFSFVRLIGREGKHLKLNINQAAHHLEAIAFGMGELYGKLQQNHTVDLAYTIDMNVWNGNRSLQLKIKDIHLQN